MSFEKRYFHKYDTSNRLGFGDVNCGNLYNVLLQLGRQFMVLYHQESARTAEDYDTSCPKCTQGE